MEVKFTKMHGCGNDYIYVNCLKTPLVEPEKAAVRLSDRHFGIGGDGLVLICPSEVADARMRMFNADGSEGKMCGNAIRCVGKYLYDNKLTDKTNLVIQTGSGIKKLWLKVIDGAVVTVTVDMGAPVLKPAQIPVLADGDSVIGGKITVLDKTFLQTCVSMGNPHAVVFVDDTDNFELEKYGSAFETAPIFPDRVNTEFVQVLGKNSLKMRVWERGSGETFACGTGACAAAVAATLNGYAETGADISVQLRGGTLKIKYTGETVYMTGPAEKVFDGIVNI